MTPNRVPTITDCGVRNISANHERGHAPSDRSRETAKPNLGALYSKNVTRGELTLAGGSSNVHSVSQPLEPRSGPPTRIL